NWSLRLPAASSASAPVQEKPMASAFIARSAPQHTESINPQGEKVEILPIAVGLFPDTNAALSPKHAVDLSHEFHCPVQIGLLIKCPIERDKKNEAESIGPEIAQPIRPNPLRAHPRRLAPDIINVL